MSSSTASLISTSAMSNSAAWLISRGSKLSVKPAPTPVVGEYDVIIRSRAVAINPFDSLVQRAEADVVAEFPKILGHDVAGEVVAVGAKAGHKIGDRVLAFADGCLNVPKYGGFQKLVTADHLSVCRIPDLLSFVDASVIPLGLATAAVGLFRSDLLGLDLPKSSGGQIFAPKNGKSVLVWGGASSVGSNAVQLAAAAGYKVVSTASPKNFEVVRALGADAVFDYQSDTAVRDIVQELDGSEFAGAYCAVAGVLGAASEIVKQTGGRQFVASAPYLPMEYSSDIETKWVNIQIGEKSLEVDRVLEAVFGEFLPQALSSGYKIFPPPLVVGHGLDSIQNALDVQHDGVSARKIVVEL